MTLPLNGGAFTAAGSVSGRLGFSLFGSTRRLASGSFAVRYNASGFRVESTESLNLTLPFGTFKFAGFFQSNGAAAFTGAGTFPYLPNSNKTVTFRISRTSTGQVTLTASGAFGSGTVDSTGLIRLSNGLRLPLTPNAAFLNGLIDPIELNRALDAGLGAVGDGFNAVIGSVGAAIGSVLPTQFRFFDGYIAGGDVFLDVNRNGVRDLADLNGNGIPDAGDLLEPAGTTDADGFAELFIPTAFDRNANGRLDPDEGVVVATGGVDMSTLLPFTGTLMLAPSENFGVASPLTTLHAGLVGRGMDVDTAWEAVRTGFGLPADLALESYDAIAAWGLGDATAADVFRAGAQVQNFLTQFAAIVQGTDGRSVGPAAAEALSVLAGHFAAGGTSADLSSSSSMTTRLAAWTDANGNSLAPDVIEALARVISSTNAAIVATPATGGDGFIAAVSRSQAVAQGVGTVTVQALVSGSMSPGQVIAQWTDEWLTDATASTSVGSVVPPTLSLTGATTEITPGGTRVTVIAELSTASPLPVSGQLTVSLPTGEVVTVPAALTVSANGRSAMWTALLPGTVEGSLSVELDGVTFARPGVTALTVDVVRPDDPVPGPIDPDPEPTPIPVLVPGPVLGSPPPRVPVPPTVPVAGPKSTFTTNVVGRGTVQRFGPDGGATVSPFGAGFRGEIVTALTDLTGDGVLDLIAGVASGGAPHVKVIDGATGGEVYSFFAFDPSFTGGIFVAAGDVTGDGTPDILVGAGPGGGPHVKVIDGATGDEVYSFFAYDPAFSLGVRVAAGDVTGDGFADIATAAGPGGAPHVKVFDGLTGQETLSYLAYGEADTGGVWLTVGDITGDGRAEVVTGPGAGASHVRAFDADSTEVASFFAYDPSFLGGVRVAVADVDGDGVAEVVAAPGPGGGPHIRVIQGTTGVELDSLLVGEPGDALGVFVG